MTTSFLHRTGFALAGQIVNTGFLSALFSKDSLKSRLIATSGIALTTFIALPLNIEGVKKFSAARSPSHKGEAICIVAASFFLPIVTTCLLKLLIMTPSRMINK